MNRKSIQEYQGSQIKMDSSQGMMHDNFLITQSQRIKAPRSRSQSMMASQPLQKDKTITRQSIVSLGCSGNTTRIMRRNLMIILVFTLCEEEVKWNSVLMRLIDDLLALDSIICFGFSDQRLERTATFSISTNSE
ncbi:hypothetical protein Tco_0912008 [Tanacetum coccineum]